MRPKQRLRDLCQEYLKTASYLKGDIPLSFFVILELPYEDESISLKGPYGTQESYPHLSRR